MQTDTKYGQTIVTRNCNSLAQRIYPLFEQDSIVMPSRNGPVKRLKGVTTIVIERPWERVCFSGYRDCNPFFHLIEGLCMISPAPLNDVDFLSHFASNMRNFSDDGETFNAFYGTRARVSWGDQVREVIRQLTADINTRQAVINLWDPMDLWKQTKDKACNTQLLFANDGEGKITMTSFNRSNDAIWGFVTGANIVHLSMFHEYIATSVGTRMGVWTHISNNMHVYTENPQYQKCLEACALNEFERSDYYNSSDLVAFNLISEYNKVSFDFNISAAVGLMADCAQKGELLQDQFSNVFVEHTVKPMFNTWQLWKKYKKSEVTQDDVIASVNQIKAEDWNLACKGWLLRRIAKQTNSTEQQQETLT